MRVVVGRIGKAHGIRGEVTVEVRTDEPELRFRPGGALLTDSGGNLVVSSVRPHGGGLIVAFEGISDRTTAEGLRGTLLEIERPADQVPDGDDEYYDSDLIGCAVTDTEGRSLGVVDEVVHLPAQDLISIAPAQGRPWLIPLVHELVPSIDLAARSITVAPPPGLSGLADAASDAAPSDGQTPADDDEG